MIPASTDDGPIGASRDTGSRGACDVPADGQQPDALDVIRRAAAYVGASDANRDAFARSPVAVLRAAAADFPRAAVERAERILEEVLAVARPDLTRQAQALLGVVASVVIARGRRDGSE